MNVAAQSPEADIDRDIEKIVGEAVRGTISADSAARLVELYSKRLRLMRPSASVKRPVGYFSRRFG